MPCARQRIVQGPDIRFGPAIVVGRDDIDGAGDQGKESKPRQLHDDDTDRTRPLDMSAYTGVARLLPRIYSVARRGGLGGIAKCGGYDEDATVLRRMFGRSQD